MTARLVCSRCRRPLIKAAATVAGMPLGPDCARQVAAAVRTTPLEAAADRTTRAAEAAFRARQIPLLEAA